MEPDSGRVESERNLTVLLCPECMVNKHGNCAGFTVDDDDCIVQCECPVCDGVTDTGGFIPPFITDRIPGHEGDQP